MNQVLLSLAAAVAFSTALHSQPSSADVAAGAKTFRSHCAVCHGPNAEGGRGPRLSNGVFHHGNTDADLLRNISNGIPGTGMPGIFYNEDRVRQIVAYLRSLNASAKASGDAARGREVYRARGCAQCHRIDGQGGRLGPDLTEIGRARAALHLRTSILDPNVDVSPEFWIVSFTGQDGKPRSGFLCNEDTYSVQFLDFDENLRSMEKSTLRDYQVSKTSKMPSFKGVLGDKELDDLVAWLVSLKGAAK